MSSNNAITVDGVSKRYEVYQHPSDRLKQFLLPRLTAAFRQPSPNYFREFWALRDISFEVRKGESVGVLGRNGAGKSTLLQLVTGTISPTTGSVHVDGKVSALLELGSGFNPEFTGRENVVLGGAILGWSALETQEKFASIAAFADIGDFMDLPVKTYSTGMYARLAFSAAIHSDPEILIIDEILAVGDAAFQSKCIQRIYRMMDNGVSVLLVSHDAYQVRSICQKAIVLDRGGQRFFGSADRAMDEYLAILAPSQSPPESVAAVVPHNDGGGEIPQAIQNPGTGFTITIEDVEMSTPGHGVTDVVASGDSVQLRFVYRILGNYDGDLSFVVNLYRDDGVYVFGTTTAMCGIAPYAAQSAGVVTVEFPSLGLVSGTYKWRVAVNDGRGLHIIAEAVPVCPFTVEDDFKAVGVVDLENVWHVNAIGEDS